MRSRPTGQPFRSKKQQSYMYAAEKRGEIPAGTAEKWAAHTSNMKDLPIRVKPKAKKKRRRS